MHAHGFMFATRVVWQLAPLAVSSGDAACMWGSLHEMRACMMLPEVQWRQYFTMHSVSLPANLPVFPVPGIS